MSSEIEQFDMGAVDELKTVYIKLVQDRSIRSMIKIRTPESAVKLVGDSIKDLDREVSCIVNLKADGTPLNMSIVNMGDISVGYMVPGNAVKAALLSNASGMIILHNHPGGSLVPSTADIRTTDRMIQVCKLMGIDLLDSIIVVPGTQDYFSLREKAVCNFYADENAYAKEMGELHFAGKKGRGGRV